MTSLRKEYSKSKKRNERIVSEAALKWLAENVIIINEKLDRKSVTRLIGSIQKFEDTFGPFKDKIPSIGGHLDAAESGLQLVITGKSSDSKTSNMLKQLSYLYSSLSDFFTRDLPVLLKARIFKAAKEQPDQRISAIPSVTPSGSKHDLIVIRDSLANAIKPSVAEKKLLGKIYRSTKLPKLNANQVATELLSLTYNDLEELTSIGKVPMVATPEEAENVAELGAEGAAATSPAVPGGGEQIATESVFRDRDQLLTEGILTEASMTEVGPILQQVQQIITNTGLTELQGPMNKLYSDLTKYLGSAEGVQAKETIKGADKRALGDFFKSTGGVLLKQANMTIETMKSVGQAWPNIQKFLDKPEVTDADLSNVKNMLTKAVSGGLFKKAAQSFGITTQPYPGLEPQSIVDAISKSTLGESVEAARKIALLEKKLQEAEPPGMVANPPPASAADQPGSPASAEEVTNAPAAGVEKFRKAMTALHGFATGAAGTAQTAPSTVPASPQQSTDPAATKASTDTTGTGPASGKEVAGISSETVDDVVTGLQASPAFSKQTPEAIKGFVANINNAGYKLVKK